MTEPTALAPSEDATEVVTAWAFDADEVVPEDDESPGLRPWPVSLAVAAATLLVAGLVVYGLLAWWPHHVTPIASPTPTSTPSIPAPAPAAEMPYWPDGAYLRVVAQTCGDACGPQTRAALDGCPEQACKDKRADIVVLGHIICEALKTESPAEAERELTASAPGHEPTSTPGTARAAINSAIQVYCPGAATPLP